MPPNLKLSNRYLKTKAHPVIKIIAWKRKTKTPVAVPIGQINGYLPVSSNIRRKSRLSEGNTD